MKYYLSPLKAFLILRGLILFDQALFAEYDYPKRKDVSFNGQLIDMQKRFTDYINKTGNTTFIQVRQLSLEGMKLNDAMENRKAIICYLKAELLLSQSGDQSAIKDLLLADILQNKGRTYHYVGRKQCRYFCEDSKKINERLIYNNDVEIARFAYFFLATNYDMLGSIYAIHFQKEDQQMPYTAVSIKRNILKMRGPELGRSYWNYSACFGDAVSKNGLKDDSLIYYSESALEEFKLDKTLDRVYNGEFISTANVNIAQRFMNFHQNVDSCKYYAERAIESLSVKGSYKFPQPLPAFLDYEELIRMSRPISSLLCAVYERTKDRSYLTTALALLDSARQRLINYSAETFVQGYRNSAETNASNRYFIQTFQAGEKFPLTGERANKIIAEIEKTKSFYFKKHLIENNLFGNGKKEISEVRRLSSEYERLETERNKTGKIQYLQQVLSILVRVDSLEQLAYKKVIVEKIESDFNSDLIGAIPKNINSNTIILNYYYNDLLSYCSVITKQGIEIYKLEIDFKKKQTIDSLNYLSATLQKPNLQFYDLSHRVYSWLVEPYIKNHSEKELIIIPSFDPMQFSFESLVTSFQKKHDGNVEAHYLIENYNIRYEYSLEPFYRTQGKNEINKSQKVVAFAPRYESDTKAENKLLAQTPIKNEESKLRSESTPLKFNVSEVEEVTAANGGALYLNYDATEEMFRKVSATADILHLAMHGFSRTDDPMNSGLVFTKNKSDITINSTVINSDSTYWLNDGIVHAYELYQMKFKADLAVLSACETGIGQYVPGEGSKSLGLAFRYSGCKNTVMSLWKVDDQSTKELMKLFYKNLGDGVPKADALSKAKRDFIKNNPTAGPFYWSTFVLFGDNEPVHLNKKLNHIFWILSGALISIVIGIFGFKKIFKA